MIITDLFAPTSLVSSAKPLVVSSPSDAPEGAREVADLLQRDARLGEHGRVSDRVPPYGVYAD